MDTKLLFGGTRIAENGSKFRTAVATDEFWTEWNDKKDQLKEQKISIYKNDNIWSVYDFSLGEANENERAEWLDHCKEAFVSLAHGSRDLSNDDIDEIAKMISNCKSIKELKELADEELSSGFVEVLKETADITTE